MVRYEVPLVDSSGRTIGYGDRWLTHRVRSGPDGTVLGRKHVGITIACLDHAGRILTAHRRHRIFDRVWTLSGDTHPYRVFGSRTPETLPRAATRCALDDLGVKIEGWTDRLTVSYAARDPRDPRYCENELLHLMVARHGNQLRVNKKNAYDVSWVEPARILEDSLEDSERDPLDRKYAPWVHAVFALSPARLAKALSTG